MDFLRRIGRFIGGAAQNVGRAFQQAPQFISRGVQDAERARQQAIAQVQRNLPRFQAPPPPRIQLPPIQIPRVQAPRIDLGAVSRALQGAQQTGAGIAQGLDITKRTAFGQQLTPQQQRLVSASPQLQSQIRQTKAILPTGQDITKLLRASAPAVDIGLAVKEKGLGAFSAQERMQRGIVPAIQQQVSRTGQKLLSTPEGQMLLKQPGFAGQIGRLAETAAFRPQQAITGGLQSATKALGQLPGLKQIGQTKPGKIISENLIDPTLQSFIKNLGQIGGAQAGQKTYAKGLQGEMQNLADIVNIGSLFYSGNLAKQLGTKGTPFFSTAAKLAPRLWASGTGQDLITQLSEGKKPNEIDWKRALLAGGAYTTFGIGIPGVTRGGSKILSKAFGSSTATKAAQGLAGVPVAKAAQGAPVPKAIAENVYPIRPGVPGRLKPAAGSVVDATPGLTVRAQQQFAESKRIPGEVATAGLNSNFQLGTPGNIQKYILDAKGKPVGGIVGFYEGPNRAVLSNVYVLPGQRGKGAASKLVKAFEEEARINGVSEVKLTSKADKLYEKLNYKIDPNYEPSAIKTNYIKTLQPPKPIIKPQQAITGGPQLPQKPIYETVPKSAMEPKGPKSFDELIKNKQISAKEAEQVQALGMTPKEYLDMKIGGPSKTLPSAELGQPITAMQQVPEGMKRSQFANQLEFDAGVPNQVLGDLFPGYKPLSNETVYKNAVAALDQNQGKIVQDLIAGKVKPTAESNAQAMIALRRLIDAEDFGTATKLAQATIAQGTDAGRAVQIFSRWRATTPEGALLKANKIVNEVNAKLPMNKKIELGRDKVIKIQEIAKNIQNFAEGTRDRQVQEALLAKEIADIVPPSQWKKVSTLQTMMQLLNAKTAIRNVLGNTVAAGSNDVAGFLGAGIEKALVKTGLLKQRSVAAPSIRAGLKGFAQGAKYGAQDVKLGIKTSGAAGSFDIQPQVFKNQILRKLENTMGYELSVPDKAFYQRAFDTSLDSQMKAASLNGKAVTKPTAQMVAQANEEGLYQTFQNNSKLAEMLVQAKHWMNAGKDFGVGDFVLKYPKTPGNIVAQGIDFTPYGVYKGSKQLIEAARTATLNPITQRNAILNIGRGLTGTGLMSLGAVLASAGIITADKNTNKNVNAYNIMQGGGPFTLNVSALQRYVSGGDTAKKAGDLIVNYDWLQPNAIQLSMGANLVLAPKQKNKIGEFLDNSISSVNSAVNTVIEQPVLQGVSRVLSKVAGGQAGKADLVGAISDIVASAPSSFIPSILNQVGQLTDKYARETRTSNIIQEITNKVMQRLPGARQGLPIKYNTFGAPVFQFDPQAGGNNIFNVFLNPAIPRTVKDGVAFQLVDDLYNKTGSTEMFPKVEGDKVTISKGGRSQSIGLNTQQISDYQKYVGERTYLAYTELANDPAFRALSPEEQTNKLSNIMSNINTAAKVQLFGHSPKSISAAEQNIINGGDPSQTQFTKAKKPKLKISKARKGRTGRRGGRARVAKTKLPSIKLPKVTVKSLPSVPTVKAKKVSFKVAKPKATARKSIKIKTG